MLNIYRIKTRSRKSSTYLGCLEYQYIKEKLTCFRYCPIKNKFIVFGWRWAGNSMFGFRTPAEAKKWGCESLCKRKEEFILIGAAS